MKKLGLSILMVALLISCTVNQWEEDKEEVSDDEIIIVHDEHFRGIERVVFKDVEVTTIIEQISATEEVEVLLINAFSGSETNQHLIFKVFPNSLGNNVLFNNFFVYKFDRGLTVIYTNPNDSVSLNVLTNNDSQFTATFSGELEHWNNGTQQLQLLDISSGTISIKY